MKLIDRDALLAEMPTIESEYKYARKIILEQPVIDAVPVRHGTWKPVSEDWRHQIEWWECSECNFSASTKYNYCPNCGAKMDAGETEWGLKTIRNRTL